MDAQIPFVSGTEPKPAIGELTNTLSGQYWKLPYEASSPVLGGTLSVSNSVGILATNKFALYQYSNGITNWSLGNEGAYTQHNYDGTNQTDYPAGLSVWNPDGSRAFFGVMQNLKNQNTNTFDDIVSWGLNGVPNGDGSGTGKIYHYALEANYNESYEHYKEVALTSPGFTRIDFESLQYTGYRNLNRDFGYVDGRNSLFLGYQTGQYVANGPLVTLKMESNIVFEATEELANGNLYRISWGNSFGQGNKPARYYWASSLNTNSALFNFTGGSGQSQMFAINAYNNNLFIDFQNYGTNPYETRFGSIRDSTGPNSIGTSIQIWTGIYNGSGYTVYTNSQFWGAGGLTVGQGAVNPGASNFVALGTISAGGPTNYATFNSTIYGSEVVTNQLSIRGRATVTTTLPSLNTWYTNGVSRKDIYASFELDSTVANSAGVLFYMVPASGTTNTFGRLQAGSGLILTDVFSHTVYADPNASYMWSNMSAGTAAAAFTNYFDRTN